MIDGRIDGTDCRPHGAGRDPEAGDRHAEINTIINRPDMKAALIHRKAEPCLAYARPTTRLITPPTSSGGPLPVQATYWSGRTRMTRDS